MAPFRFSLGRGTTQSVPREQQRPLLHTSSAQASALARLNLKPATVALGRQTRGSYACLGTPSGRSMHGGGSGVYSGGEESGDEEDGEVLPQNTCRRCCLGLCVLTVLLVAGTGLVLRFLLARDSHPSSPAAKLASLSVRRTPPPPKASRAAVSFVGSTRRTSPPPLFKNPGPPLPPPPQMRHSPPWPPWPPAPNPPPEPLPPPADPHSPYSPPPPPPSSPPPFPGPSPHPPPTPPCAPWPPLIQSPPPPSPPLPLREMGALTIPAVAARIEARTKQHRARNETRDSRVKL